MDCKQKKADCRFITTKGNCKILSDTIFNRPCPFYKKGYGDIIGERHFPGMAEAFRAIENTGGKYYVSERGDVANSKGKLLARKHDRNGRAVVTITSISGRSTSRSVAVLVAEAFVPGAGAVVLLDGDPDNCEAWNIGRAKDNGGENK